MPGPRKAVFDAIRAAKGSPLQVGEVAAIDGLLDGLGVPRDTPPTGGLRPSAKAFDIIQEFEGYARALPNGDCKAYPDHGSGGEPWTIGFGSTGYDVRPGTVWTRQQAVARLESDVIKFANGVAQRLQGAATSQGEFDAMASLAYNVGLGNFEGSTLLRKHKAGDKAGAAAEFAKWNKASGRVMSGLVRRRAAEAALYRGQA